MFNEFNEFNGVDGSGVSLPIRAVYCVVFCLLYLIMRAALCNLQEDKTALHLACERGSLEIVTALIAAGDNIEEKDGVGTVTSRRGPDEDVVCMDVM
jgi:Ankyrin repeat